MWLLDFVIEKAGWFQLPTADGLAPVLALSPDGGAVAVVEGGNRLLYLGGGQRGGQRVPAGQGRDLG
ncbi:MAG: hypothetical protein IMW96_10410 [Thermoanaerobacteraceae bacterium]|nr:hypothetical protein [Thermoanaerobacteraceae bacterium]